MAIGGNGDKLPSLFFLFILQIDKGVDKLSASQCGLALNQSSST